MVVPSRALLPASLMIDAGVTAVGAALEADADAANVYAGNTLGEVHAFRADEAKGGFTQVASGNAVEG